jgi:hypothetical protein
MSVEFITCGMTENDMELFKNIDSRKYLATLPVALISTITLLHYSHPVGNGGLYLIWSEQLSSYWPLPVSTTRYSVINIPFGYPPISFWIVNLVHDLTGVSRIDVMRTTGKIFYIMIWPVYWYWANRETDGKIATTATLIASLSPLIAYRGINISGITSNIGDLLLLVGVVGSSFVFSDDYGKWLCPILITGLAFGLTLLSYPPAAFAFGVWVFFEYLLIDRSVRGFAKGAMIVAIGLILSSVWWVPVVQQHSFVIFQRLFQPSSQATLVRNLIVFFQPRATIRVLPVLALSLPFIGGIYFLSKRSYRLPVIAAALLSTVYLSYGYLVLSLFAATAIWEIVLPQLTRPSLPK